MYMCQGNDQKKNRKKTKFFLRNLESFFTKTAAKYIELRKMYLNVKFNTHANKQLRKKINLVKPYSIKFQS